MMQVFRSEPHGFAANTYFVTADRSSAVAVDPAQPFALGEAERLGLSVRYVLLTHGHFDHIGGCAALQGKGARVGCLAGEEETVLRRNLGVEMGGAAVPPFTVDFTFRDGEILSLCGVSFEVIATPGHTSGSCCLLAREAGSGDPALFTGDTLFCGGVGRTDLPTGSAPMLRRSLVRLANLPFDCPVYPGHGENTTLLYEKQTNGWLKC